MAGATSPAMTYSGSTRCAPPHGEREQMHAVENADVPANNSQPGIYLRSVHPDPHAAFHRGGDIGPGRLVRGKLLPQIRHELGDLPGGHAVLERWHVAEIARHRPAMPCRITWMRLSGTALCRLLLSASDGCCRTEPGRRSGGRPHTRPHKDARPRRMPERSFWFVSVSSRAASASSPARLIALSPNDPR